MRPTPYFAAALAIALASAAPASAAERLVEASKVFRYLTDYLSAPVKERDQFTVVYRIRTADGAPLSGVKLNYVEGAVRTPVPLAADGRLLRLPTMAQAKGQIAVDTAPGEKMQATGPFIEPTVAASREIPAARLTVAIAQVNAMVKRSAGLASALAPSYDRVRFEGASGGAVVEGDGARKPLPLQDGSPVFEAAAHVGARAVMLQRAPSHMQIGSKPKG